jgi:hypothetical protein
MRADAEGGDDGGGRTNVNLPVFSDLLSG